jgi:hypothetical protein
MGAHADLETFGRSHSQAEKIIAESDQKAVIIIGGKRAHAGLLQTYIKDINTIIRHKENCFALFHHSEGK